jgi:hypothetical protein
MKFGYGGLILAYIHNPDELIHLNYKILIGGGGGLSYNSHPGTALFVVEPGAGLMIDIAEHFRVNLEASYRFISGADSSITGIDDADLSGLAVNVSFLFGNF